MFRASEPGGGRLVAVKVFRLDITPEHAAALVGALERLIARLDNVEAPIAAPIAAGLDAHAAYLAMEYAVGDSLDVAADSSPRPLDEVAPIITAVADALDRSAERGVRHQLLHPRDIIISADGARLTGLGIAEALSSIGITLPVRRPYAAPEGPSDVYSLAAIAYELISGRRMSAGGWDELSAEDGPELRDAFAAALADDPRERPPLAGDFAAMLCAAAGLKPRTTSGMGHGRVLGQFADPGAASDLQTEFSEPPPPDAHSTRTPLPPASSAQPPKLFQTLQAEAPNRRGLTVAGVLLLVVAICFGGGYAWRLRTVRPVPAAQTPPRPSPVTSTTVELPPPAASTVATPKPPERTTASPASSAARTSAVRPSKGQGRLLIRSTPADAAVLINGEARGKTPLAVRDLPLGSYTIHLARDGYAAADRRVRLTAKRPSAALVVALTQTRSKSNAAVPGAARNGRPTAPAASEAHGAESRGSVAVQSRPAGARVFVNDRLVGSTPLAIPNLPAAPATVRIEMDGYQPWTTTVQVKAGQRTTVTASLERR